MRQKRRQVRQVHGAVVVEVAQTRRRRGPEQSAWSNVESSQQEVPVVMVTAPDAAAGEPSNTGTFTFTRLGSTSAPLTVYFTVK